MNKKSLLKSSSIGVLILIVGTLFFVNEYRGKGDVSGNDPNIEIVTIRQSSSIELLTIDEKIRRAELIVVGQVENVLASRWKAPNGLDSKGATPEEIFRAGGLFTDSTFSIDQTLKGKYPNPTLRIRSFIGEIQQVRWVDSSQPTYKPGQSYLLFLKEDTGPSENVDPGDFMSINSIGGVYEIVDGKAISGDEVWVLEELIAHIQKSVSESN